MQQYDYTRLEFIGINSGIVGLTYVFREIAPLEEKFKISLTSLLHEQISVSEQKFNRELKQLEKRIDNIEKSWEYQSLVNFDKTELNRSMERYSSMQKLKEQVDAYLKFKPRLKPFTS